MLNNVRVGRTRISACLNSSQCSNYNRTLIGTCLGFAFKDASETSQQQIKCLVNVCHAEACNSACNQGCFAGEYGDVCDKDDLLSSTFSSTSTTTTSTTTTSTTTSTSTTTTTITTEEEQDEERTTTTPFSTTTTTSTTTTSTTTTTTTTTTTELISVSNADEEDGDCLATGKCYEYIVPESFIFFDEYDEGGNKSDYNYGQYEDHFDVGDTIKISNVCNEDWSWMGYNCTFFLENDYCGAPIVAVLGSSQEGFQN